MEENKLFLVIDDDSDDRELFAEAIREMYPSCQCISAINGLDALKKIRMNEPYPDYIFLDLNMPGMDGFECLSELKKDPFLQKIPVVIFSTSSTRRDIEETRAMGAIYFLTKPTSYKKLCDEILLALAG